MGDLAICVAINDNDRAWYEMLVPFVLSLRRTDYQGHLVVIDFGLSQRKIDILNGQSITVMVSQETPLAVARYLEVARLCELNPGLRKAALYDADIWFCRQTHDLFDLVQGDTLFACRDPLFCDFIVDGLIGPHREEHSVQVRETVLAMFGGALQAGLVAGSAQAWRDFGAFVRDCVSRVGVDFKDIYGFDTTILHLWAAKSRVVSLPDTQNFLLKSGVIEARDEHNVPLLMSASGPIRALHMTSNLRFLNCWRFFSLHRAEALAKGDDFSLVREPLRPSEPMAEVLRPEFEQMGLGGVVVHGEAGGTMHTSRDGDGLHVIGTGNHRIELTALRDIRRCMVTVMHLSGLPAPIQVSVRADRDDIVCNRDASQWIALCLTAGQTVTLSSRSLPGQMCKLSWTVSADPLLWQ